MREFLTPKRATSTVWVPQAKKKLCNNDLRQMGFETEIKGKTPLKCVITSFLYIKWVWSLKIKKMPI